MTHEVRGWLAGSRVSGILFDVFDRCPEAFGGSFKNFTELRKELDAAEDSGELSDGTIAEVLKRLDAMQQTAKDVMRESEAAEYLGVSVKTLKRWCFVDGLPHREVADKRIYSRKAIEAWAAGRDVLNEELV